MIDDLDGFVQWISNEMTMKRISRRAGNKIIAAIDVVENAIEKYQY
jgi:acyl-CoA reductase-like NAD-dependent aldehyde dehydrogenase